MGALEQLEIESSTSEGMSDFQEAWAFFVHEFALVIHEGWWFQIPGGINLMEELETSRCALDVSQSITQLLQLDFVDDVLETQNGFSIFALFVFENWPYVVEQLGEMLLASSYSPHTSSNHEIRQFYALLVKAFQLKEQDLDISSMGLMAWSMLSLITPRGMLQRIHLTLPPVLVTEIQSLRHKLFRLDWLQKEIIKNIIPPLIVRLKKELGNVPKVVA